MPYIFLLVPQSFQNSRKKAIRDLFHYIFSAIVPYSSVKKIKSWQVNEGKWPNTLDNILELVKKKIVNVNYFIF